MSGCPRLWGRTGLTDRVELTRIGGLVAALLAVLFLISQVGVPFVDLDDMGVKWHPRGGGDPTREVTVSTEPQSPKPALADTYVTPEDLGSTVGAVDPDGVIEGDIDIVTDRELVENVTINGCVVIDADDVTLRNVAVNCGETYPIKVNEVSGTRIENVTVDCLADSRARKGIFFEFSENFGVDRIEVRQCDDQFFVDGGVGESWITNSVFHHQIAGETAHTDGVQIGEFETTTGRLHIEGNWWQYDREGCCDNAIVFASSHAELDIEVRGNYLDGDFGTHLLRCHGTSRCLVFGNEIDGTPEGLLIEADGDTIHEAGCNTYVGGGEIEPAFYTRTMLTDDC